MKKILILIFVLFNYSFADIACSMLPFETNPSMKKCLEVIKKIENNKNITTSKRNELLSGNMFSAASAYENKKEYKNTAILYQKLVDINQNNYQAKYSLGVLYAQGFGVQKNHIKAYTLFKDALKGGQEDAQSGLEILCGQSPWACKE